MSVSSDQMSVNLSGANLQTADPSVTEAQKAGGASQVNAPPGKGVSGAQDKTERLTAQQNQQSQPSLPSPSLYIDVEDAILMLAALRSKVGDQQQQISVTDVKAKQAEQTEEHKERLEQLQKAADKMEKAKKAGVFGKIFGWIASIASIVAGAVLIATGVGAAVGGLLLAGGVIGLGMQIAQQIPAARDWMAKNPAFGYAMMGVQLLLAVATLGAGAAEGVGEIAAEGVEEGAEIAESAAEASETAAEIADGVGSDVGKLSDLDDLVDLDDLPEADDGLSSTGDAGDDVGNLDDLKDLPDDKVNKYKEIARTVKRIAAGVTGAADVGKGASDITTSVYSSQADKAKAEAKKIEAELLQKQGQIDDELHRLKEIMKEVDDGYAIFMQILNNIGHTKVSVIRKMNV